MGYFETADDHRFLTTLGLSKNLLQTSLKWRYLMSNQFYVYVYLDPRKPGNFKYGDYEFNYEPFYVGKGKGRRYNIHLLECFKKQDKNYQKVNKITKILKETNKNPVIIKFEENLLEQNALNLEIKMIKTIGRIDLKTGPLTNLTDGGDNQKGFHHSDETKRKISIMFKGKPKSSEQKIKISNSQKGDKNHRFGKHLTEEHKQKLSEMSKFENNANCKFVYIFSNNQNYWNLSKHYRTKIREQFEIQKTNLITYKGITITKILKKRGCL